MATSLEMQDRDLIDLNASSPVLPRSSVRNDFESSTESLLDSELSVLEEKLQKSQGIGAETVINRYVDIEDILITIDDEDNNVVSGSAEAQLEINNATLNGLNNDDFAELHNLEVYAVLTKLDEILSETLEDPSFSEARDNESQNETVEDCLEDLDNYLKALESNYLPESANVSLSTTQSTVLLTPSQSEDESIELSDSSGQINLGFEDTENIPSLIRGDCLRATVADIGRPAFERNDIKRRSLNEIDNPRTHVRISGTGVNLTAEVDLNCLQECRSYPPGDCSTGTVVVEPIHNRESSNHETSWVRSSMRRIRHLRLPSNETPNETEIQVPEVNEMVVPRVEIPQCNNLQTESASVRPFSAPSRLTTHTNVATQSSVRVTRDSRSNTISREPGGHIRGRSASSRSRRPRSLSSSESSLASSVYTTPSCTPDPTPVRNNPEVTPTANARRPCERTRTNDMPEAESPLGHWPHSLSSMLACLGCTLGLFNLSRFAMLTIQFGANFILQFFALSIVIGLPLFTLQMCLGQQLGAGVIDMWKISPLFQGVGVALLATQAFIGLYSIMGISWLFVYFRDSFITKVDKYRWAEPFYYYRDLKDYNNSTNYKLSETVPDYFNGVVLQRHHLKSGSYSGTIKFQLAFNLVVVWMIVFVSLSKGLRSYGKVVYVFSLLPVFGIFVVCAKVLSLIPSDTLYSVFPETSWGEFFLNSRSWVAASQEVLLTWGLLGAATMQIASHNKHKHLLQRDSSLIAVLTFAILLMTSFLANTCVQILHANGYSYLPSSFEKMSAYTFLQRSQEYVPTGYTTMPVRYMPHHSFIVGERVSKPGVDSTMESGYQINKMTQNTSWDIIYWEGEESTDFVPSVWANEARTQYKFPVGPRMSESKKRALVYNCSHLKDNEYIWYNAKCKKGNITNLERARSLCKTATITSNLDTEDTDALTTDEEEPDVEPPIHTKKHRRLLSGATATTSYNSERTTERAIVYDIPALESISSPPSVTSEASQSSKISSIDVANIQFSLKEISKKVDKLESLLQLLLSNQNPSTAAAKSKIENVCKKLPLGNKEEMDIFEIYLDDPEEAKALEEVLYLAGGENAHKAVYNIMKKILVPEACLLYSGIGKKQKLAFCTLKVYRIIVDATRRRFPNSSDVEIKKSVSTFLATAKDRMKGKKNNL